MASMKGVNKALEAVPADCVHVGRLRASCSEGQKRQVDNNRQQWLPGLSNQALATGSPPVTQTTFINPIIIPI